MYLRGISMYKMMTAKEVIDLLWDTKSVDFTFDNIDEDPDCDPTGWYGVKLINIFDEQYGVIAMGYYGGGFTYVYEIEQLDPEVEKEEELKQVCVWALEKYLSMMRENEGYDSDYGKVCVEIKEE